MAYESGVAESWLYKVLSEDLIISAFVAGRIFNTLPRVDTVYPCVIYQYQGGHDVRGLGSHRIMVDSLYLVKAIATDVKFWGSLTQYERMDLSAAKNVYDSIDLAIQGGSGTVEGGVVYGCVREQPMMLEEINGSFRYRHWGGIYRIWWRGTPPTA